VAASVVAGRFHNAVADVVLTACLGFREEHGIGVVALSGGVFQNLLLTTRVVDLLVDKGFEVLTHHRVPTNDGGISLGQAVVAASVSTGLP
jgi:hydrogenase maturation protein HypF